MILSAYLAIAFCFYGIFFAYFQSKRFPNEDLWWDWDLQMSLLFGILWFITVPISYYHVGGDLFRQGVKWK